MRSLKGCPQSRPLTEVSRGAVGIRKGCGEHQLGPKKPPQKADEWEGGRGAVWSRRSAHGVWTSLWVAQCGWSVGWSRKVVAVSYRWNEAPGSPWSSLCTMFRQVFLCVLACVSGLQEAHVNETVTEVCCEAPLDGERFSVAVLNCLSCYPAVLRISRFQGQSCSVMA